MDHLIWFIILALLAEILGTVGGFGSSLFFVPIASYFFDFHSVLGITAVFHVSSNLAKIAFFRKGFNKKLVFSIGLPAVLFVIVGSFFSSKVDSEVLKIALGGFLILVSVVLLVFKNVRIKPSPINAAMGGALSGLIAGMLGTGGAIRGITLAAYGLTMNAFIATSAVIDLAIDASRSAVYYFNGYVHQHDLYLIPILLMVSVSGTYVGKKILSRISEQQFKSMVLWLILLTGLTTWVNVLFG
ncbi:MAG TPA: sulfite exporter TauE/SafE family protein [Luteibaculaceae bacterium]|nr:sulfite exporter TauE/SafE family protein [Luteibaculaceae bacterium]